MEFNDALDAVALLVEDDEESSPPLTPEEEQAAQAIARGLFRKQ